MRVLWGWTVGLALVSGPLAVAAPAPTATTVKPAPVTFDALWAEAVRAEKSGDAVTAARALQGIRRLRVERNVDTEETVGLGMVLRGLEKLDGGDRGAAEESFRNAVAVAPGLPDSHFALAAALLRKGPLGLPASVSASFGGAAAFLATGRGTVSLGALSTVAWLLFAFTVCWAVAGALLLRRGGLLRHDIDEWLGPTRAVPLALFVAVLLAPCVTFQGWGWLPLWWLALLFTYLGRTEKAIALALVLAVVAVGPIVAALEATLRTASDPLYAAAVSAVEGVPDRDALVRLERAAQADPKDRELGYLLGSAWKRAGDYDRSAELYRRLLAVDPADAYARNNLAGIEFARGAYDTALARYKAGTGSDRPEVAATSYYNLSIAYLQKFDYQAFNEAKSNADRLARRLVSQYERWKFDTGDYAVVELGLSRDEVRGRFEGKGGEAASRAPAGGQSQASASSLAASLLNRFTASIGLLAVVAFVVSRWRGAKAFTLHCGKCGTAFCRQCHIGQVSSGLCSQCYHLFVVRDGVSGPARNRKLSEVQEAESRRDRVFRVLSLVSPGAGHVYAGRPLVGLALLAPWYGVLAVIAASHVLPLTSVSARLAPSWPTWLAALVLLVLWVGANRLRRPEFELALPVRRPAARRAKVA